MENVTLTVENAKNVALVVSKSNPEWGSKRFHYNTQPLNDGRFTSVVGTGSNSQVLFESEYKFWNVAAFI